MAVTIVKTPHELESELCWIVAAVCSSAPIRDVETLDHFTSLPIAYDALQPNKHLFGLINPCRSAGVAVVDML